MWYSNSDIKYFKPIEINDLRAYVLPHAGTKHTSHILSHTLRFKPSMQFKRVYILFYPVHEQPNVGNEYHEYHVPKSAFDYVRLNYWNNKNKIKYIPVDLKNLDNEKVTRIVKENKKQLHDSILIISADFSHFLPLQEAIKKENCAAHSILQKYLDLKCTDVIDSQKTFPIYK